MDKEQMFDEANQLAKTFGYWNEHPNHPVEDWKTEVSNGDTRLAYWEWVVAINSDDCISNN